MGLVVLCLATTGTARAAGSVQVWTTLGNAGPGPAPTPWTSSPPNQLSSVAFGTSTPGGTTVFVPTGNSGQIWDGVGADVTDSTVLAIQPLAKSNPTAYLSIMKELFAPGGGAGLRVLRVLFGAGDLSTSMYSYDDSQFADPGFAYFALPAFTRNQTIPFLREALALSNPNNLPNQSLKVIALAASAPWWMKDGEAGGGQTNGLTCSYFQKGDLASNHYTYYSTYLADAVNAFKSRGVPISDVSVNNEPQAGACKSGYPSMTLPASGDAAVAKDLRSALNAAGDSSVGVIAGETNLDDLDANEPSSLASLNNTNWAQAALSQGKAMGSGISAYGFHCYWGKDWARQTYEHQQFPGVQMLDTECSAAVPGTIADFQWAVQNNIIDSVFNWSSASLFYAVATNQNCGPDLSQSLYGGSPCAQSSNTSAGCYNCMGLLDVNSSTSPVTVTQSPQFVAAEMTNEVAEPGASVLTLNEATQNPAAALTGNADGTSCTDPSGPGVNYVAFKNPDGSYGLITCNNGGANGDQTLNVLTGTQQFTVPVPGWAVVAMKWTPTTLGSAPPTIKAYSGRDQKGSVKFKMQIGVAPPTGGKPPTWSYQMSDLKVATACLASGETVPGTIKVAGRTRKSQRVPFSLGGKRFVIRGDVFGSLTAPQVSATVKVRNGSCSGETLRFTAKA